MMTHGTLSEIPEALPDLLVRGLSRYAMTDNQRLIQIINNLREQMYRYRLEYVKDARAHSILISEHKDIIDKLSKKDEENTKIVIRQHITNQEKGIIRLLNK